VTSNILSKWRNRRALDNPNHDQITVAELQARIDAEGPTPVPARRRPPARPDWPVVEPPEEIDAERTQPLFRVGDAREVFKILGGRVLRERTIDNFDTQLCTWCCTAVRHPTAVRLSVGELLEHSCLKPKCFHEALRWVHANDESDRDILAEIAKRPAQVLA